MVYGLFGPDGSEVLGGCGLYPRVGPRAVELGFWLAAAHTGRGLATQAAAALTRLAFDDRSIDHVWRLARAGRSLTATPAGDSVPGRVTLVDRA